MSVPRDGGGRSRRLLLAILALALAVRLVVVATATTDDYPDQQDLVYHAHAILNGTYPSRNVEGIYSFRAPLYPLFLAVAFRVFGERYRVVTAAQALAGVALVYVLFLLARRLFGERAGLLAAAVAAVYPYLVEPIGYLQTETFYTLLTVAAVYLVLARVLPGLADGAAVGRPAVAAGVLLGLATLCRPTGQLLAAVLGLWLLGVASRAPGRRRRGWTAFAGLALGAAVVVLPWTVRNYVRFSELIVVNNQAGEVFWLGNNPYYAALLRARTPAEFHERVRRLWRKTREAGDATAGLAPARLDRYYWRQGLQYVRSAPGAWARLLLVKWIEFWRPWVLPAAYGWRTALLSAVFAVPVFVGGAVGALALWRTGRRAECSLFAAIVLVHALFFTLFHPTVRYRTPAVDVFLIVLLGGGVLHLAGVNVGAGVAAAPSRRPWGRA